MCTRACVCVCVYVCACVMCNEHVYVYDRCVREYSKHALVRACINVCLHVNLGARWIESAQRFYRNEFISTHDELVYLIYNVHINIYTALTALFNLLPILRSEEGRKYCFVP